MRFYVYPLNTFIPTVKNQTNVIGGDKALLSATSNPLLGSYKSTSELNVSFAP